MPLILPTHTCFDDAPAYVQWLIDHHQPWEHLVIVHAECQIQGVAYAHAWVEDVGADEAIIAGIVDGEPVWVALHRSAYRTKLAIQHETRYTLRAYQRLWTRQGYPGPWVKRYKHWCEQYDALVAADQ